MVDKIKQAAARHSTRAFALLQASRRLRIAAAGVVGLSDFGASASAVRALNAFASDARNLATRLDRERRALMKKSPK